MSIDREKYLEQQSRYNHSEKGRARGRRHNEKRRSDPDYRRRQTLYMLNYRNRRKREAMSDAGLTNSA